VSGATPIAIGEIEAWLVRDGADRVPPEMILTGASPDELRALVEDDADADGQLPVAYNGLLIRSAGRLILVDSGLGWLSEAEGAGGELPAALRRLGVDPSAIGDVVISHGHPDHIAGLTTPNEAGEHVPAYPVARHWLWQDEWDHWTSETALARMPNELAGPARVSLPPLDRAGLVDLVHAEREVAPGVRILPAAGHTPGHVVVEIASGGETGVFVGDAIFHPVNAAAPGWGCVFDLDPGAAAATRWQLLDRAARDRSLVLGAHLASPGRIEAAGGGYRLVLQ
jgi:glyoxylase-like metal-dependent hydrolase (beta-lactamase superfamily II)